MDNTVLRVRKKNEAFLEVTSNDPGAEMELHEFFSFMVPGHKFMPAFRNKTWDGKIYLYDRRGKTIYGGLLKYIQEFADVRQADIECVDDPYYGMPNALDSVTTDEIVKFADTLKLFAHGKKIEPRDYQYEAVHHAIQNRRALLLSPTGSGKSLIIYILIRWYLESFPSKKVLLVVPTTSLVEQMYKDFEDYSCLDEDWSVEEKCHRIYSGKEKIGIAQRIILSTWQSIYKMPASWFEPYGMVIGDEAHNFKAKSLTSIMEKLRDARYRVGTTGTIDGTQTHRLVLEGLFGPVFQVTTTKKLIDSDTLSKLDISVLLLKYEEEHCKAMREKTYQEELDWLVSHSARNKFIRNLALSQEGNTLVLFNYVEKHGKPLHEMIQSKIEEKGHECPQNRLFFVSGEVDTEEREKIRGIVEKEKNAIIVASMGTFSTGINIKNLHNIIFASPSKSQIRVLQSIGRGLRKADNGQMTRVYDIADDLHWKKKRNYTLDHAAERIRIYSKEKFDHQIFEVPLHT